MSDSFYRTFEENFRGTRELIQERLKVYVPFVQPILEVYPKAQALDLGCGRGEWLELLTSLGFHSIGVDLDDGMLSACIERKLAIHKGDAIEYLSSLSDESQVVVSAFHVVEHITFDQLRTFVSEALRVLKPGGILIMETPNPENIIVGTRNFYLDPTHQRPIPSELLNFVAKYAGFKKVKTLLLQESKDLHDKNNISLSDVISGVSPDYAVVAQKDANNTILTKTCEAFDQEYGISLDSLMKRFGNRLENLELQVQQAEIKAQQSQEFSENLSFQVSHFEKTLNDVYASNSWKITAPLRKIFDFIRLSQSIKIKQLAKKKLQHLSIYIYKRPKLKRWLLTGLNRVPQFKSRLLQIVQSDSDRGKVLVHKATPLKLSQLTPRARQIYTDIKAASENQKGVK